MSMWQDVYETFLEAEHHAPVEPKVENRAVPKAVHILIQFDEPKSVPEGTLEAHYKALERIFGPEAVEALKRAIRAQQPPLEPQDEDQEES